MSNPEGDERPTGGTKADGTVARHSPDAGRGRQGDPTPASEANAATPAKSKPVRLLRRVPQGSTARSLEHGILPD